MPWLLFLLLIPTSSAVAAGPVNDRLVERLTRAVVAGSNEVLEQIREELVGQVRNQGRSDWVLPYTQAYVTWRLAGLEDRDKSRERKRLLKQAQRTVEDALDQDPDVVELHILRGAIIGDRIDGGLSGMFLGPKADAALDRATELDPTNPRLALQRGVSAFFTPETFGGGMKPSEAYLREALVAFQARPDESWPGWGQVDALAWLGQVCAATERPDEARDHYRRALELAPGHAWIEGQLLPALDASQP